MSVVAAAVILALAAGAGPAASGPAQGRFDDKQVGFDITGAYAFRAPSEDNHQPVVMVAVSNAGFAGAYIDRWLVHRQVIEKTFKDENTAVVYLEFAPDGAFNGLSYDLGSGSGCGFCFAPVTSTVAIKDGRVVGNIKQKSENRSFDITLDVPIAPDDHGAALPPGGGEPGAAYQAFHSAAIMGGDKVPALRKAMSARLVEALDGATKQGAQEGFLDALVGQRSLDKVVVTRGYATADTAILAVEGDGYIGKRAGQVLLLKEKGVWRVDLELTEGATDDLRAQLAGRKIQ